MISIKGLSKREFLGDKFYVFCLQEYEKARYYLKSCGKPKNDFDICVIKFNKETAEIFGKFLDERRVICLLDA